jgi:hypothetical protein
LAQTAIRWPLAFKLIWGSPAATGVVVEVANVRSLGVPLHAAPPCRIVDSTVTTGSVGLRLSSCSQIASAAPVGLIATCGSRATSVPMGAGLTCSLPLQPPAAGR